MMMVVVIGDLSVAWAAAFLLGHAVKPGRIAFSFLEKS